MITIEAEDSPADDDQPNQEEGEKPIEREAGTLNFLSIEEQARVQRLLNLCESEEKVETSTQTESSAQPYVATSCSCENQIRQLLVNQEKMKRMMESILTKVQNVPESPQINCSSFTTSDISNMECTLLVHPLEGESSENESEESNKENDPTTPTSNLSNQQTQAFEEVFKRSSSMTNYAKNLVFELFKRNELVGKNCAGVKGKQGIGGDSRMAIIKENVFKKYRVPDKTQAWVQCRKAIDTALRKMKYSL